MNTVQSFSFIHTQLHSFHNASAANLRLQVRYAGVARSEENRRSNKCKRTTNRFNILPQSRANCLYYLAAVFVLFCFAIYHVVWTLFYCLAKLFLNKDNFNFLLPLFALKGVPVRMLRLWGPLRTPSYTTQSAWNCPAGILIVAILLILCPQWAPSFQGFG